MSRKIHLRVVGRFDRASRTEIATVTIDRDQQLVLVRPLRRRRVYPWPLAALAEYVVWRSVRAEFAERGRKRRGRK